MHARLPSTRDKIKHIKRWEHEDVLDKVQASPDQLPEAIAIRRQTVEHLFGTLKSGWAAPLSHQYAQKRAYRDDLASVAYNMKRMINMFGVQPLVRAIAA